MRRDGRKEGGRGSQGKRALTRCGVCLLVDGTFYALTCSKPVIILLLLLPLLPFLWSFGGGGGFEIHITNPFSTPTTPIFDYGCAVLPFLLKTCFA